MRWEQREHVIEAAARVYEADQFDKYAPAMRGDAMEDARAALVAAVGAEPVIAIRDLREWADTELRGLPDCLDGAYEAGVRWAFDVLAALLDDHTTNGETNG